MRDLLSLRQFLDSWALPGADRVPLAETIHWIAIAAGGLSRVIAGGSLGGDLAAVVGNNSSGDEQKALDVVANQIFLDALFNAPVAWVASEENEHFVQLRAGAPLAVAIDPLDGSSNLDANVSVGSIFSIWANPAGPEVTGAAPVLQKGTAQLASGFAIYGPQTALALTLRQGVQVFTLNPQTSQFILTGSTVRIPVGTREYAINASNYRSWDKPVREFVDDCMNGEGRAEKQFNMRWIASLVAEAFRILSRGGIFLYPRDARPGYENGHLRLVYEANPIALLIEEAGGRATDGVARILEIAPSSLHQRVPLVFGSADLVDRAARYHTQMYVEYETAPLFGLRGLFQRQATE